MVLNTQAIFFPVLLHVLLVALLLLRLGFLRNSAIRAREVPIRFYRSFSEGEESQYLKVAANCVKNQFEVPLLFYALTVIAYVTAKVDHALLILSWAFVLSRYVHAGIYLSTNNVSQRFLVFVFGFAVLMLAWIILAVRLLGSY